MLRRWLRPLHLCVGLVFGALFALSGLTGMALAWDHELDALLNPRLFRAAPSEVTPERVQAVLQRLAADPRYGRPTQLMLPQAPDLVYVAWYREAARASRWRSDVARQVMIDGSSFAVTGERNWGEPGFTRPLLMPTLFHLHRYLLAGDVGKTAIGVSGFVLLLTSLIGLLLAWPGRRLVAWRQVIRISFGGSWGRLAYSAHRALGVLALPLLAFMGFSGLYFNLPDWVAPVVASVADVSPAGKPSNRTPAVHPIAALEALQRAQAVFPQARLSRIVLPAKSQAPYEIRLRQSGEWRRDDGATRVSIDASDGAVLRVIDPVNGPGGDRFLGALFAVHTGQVLGIPGRAFMSLFGVLPLLFGATGLLLWLRRRATTARRNPQ